MNEQEIIERLERIEQLALYPKLKDMRESLLKRIDEEQNEDTKNAFRDQLQNATVALQRIETIFNDIFDINKPYYIK